MAKVGAKSRFTALTGAAALAILIPIIKKNEGLSLKAYEDVAGVWTICYGKAYVRPGATATKEQCDAMLKDDTAKFMEQVYDALSVDVPPPVLAAHTHFAYNVGINGYRASQVLRKTNAGDTRGGCEAIMNWFRAGGKDCRVRSNGCYGLIKRREEEVALCLSGLSPQ